MSAGQTLLVFGATGQTGRHFTSLALCSGHRVRALVRNPARLDTARTDVDVYTGSIEDPPDLDRLVEGVDSVVCLLGDLAAQRVRPVNTRFMHQLVPSMRKQGVNRLLYQAGALSEPPDRKLSPTLRAIRNTVARSYIPQHRDNEMVMRFLSDDAMDLGWMVHRAGIGSDGPSKGVLERSTRRPSIATFADCAAYNLRLLDDPTAIHTADLSVYRTSSGAQGGRAAADDQREEDR